MTETLVNEQINDKNSENYQTEKKTDYQAQNESQSFDVIKFYVRKIIEELYLKNGVKGMLNNSDYLDHMSDMFAKVLINKDKYKHASENDMFEDSEEYLHKYIGNIILGVETQAPKVFKDVEKGKQEMLVVQKELNETKQEIENSRNVLDRLQLENNLMAAKNWEMSVKNQTLTDKVADLEKLFDYFREGCIQINLDGSVNMLNSALSNILGYESMEITNQSFINLAFDSKEVDKLAKLFGNNVLNRELGVKHVAFKHKNGSKIWLRLQIKKVSDVKSVLFLNDINGFMEAINFPMKNPHIVCAFTPKGTIKNVELEDYNDKIFPGFRNILTEIGQSDPFILLPKNYKEIITKIVSHKIGAEKVTINYNGQKGNRYFRWTFRYDELENIVQCYAEDVTEEERVKKDNEQITESTLFQMAKTEEVVSKDIGPHIQTVYKITTKFVDKLMEAGYVFDLDAKQTGYAAILHDIGKIYIPDQVLNKPGKFNDQEKEIMNYHTVLGAEIISNISDSLMHQIATDIAYYHHQWWDGNEEKSYPKPGNECKGDDIPLEARVVAIVDVFDALLSKRCYKYEKDINDVKIILNKAKGTQFDAKLLDVFMDHFDEFILDRGEIINEYEKKQQKTLVEEANQAKDIIAKFKEKDRDETLQIKEAKGETIEKRTD